MTWSDSDSKRQQLGLSWLLGPSKNADVQQKLYINLNKIHNSLHRMNEAGKLSTLLMKRCGKQIKMLKWYWNPLRERISTAWLICVCVCGCVYEQLSNQYYIDDVLRAFFRPANDPANRGTHYSVTRNLMSYSHHFMSINVEDTDDVRNYCTFLGLQVGWATED